MSESEARQCAKQIRHHMESARKLILDLCEREGWRAMGYSSWSACVVAEFEQSRSYLCRQLEAARIERDVLPVGNNSEIPERHLRPLIVVPPEQRKSVWDAALATAPGGKMTGGHVAKVAEQIAPTPAQVEKAEFKAMIEAVEVEEPDDIAEQRRKGIIPEGVAVHVDEPWNQWGADPEEDETPDMAGEQSDAEFLAECPAREELSAKCRKEFDRDALLYRQLFPAREKFRNAAKNLLAANRRKGRTGHFHSTVSWFFKAEGPKHWLVCGDCKGTGRHDLIGECPLCKTMGYVTR